MSPTRTKLKWKMGNVMCGRLYENTTLPGSSISSRAGRHGGDEEKKMKLCWALVWHQVEPLKPSGPPPPLPGTHLTASSGLHQPNQKGNCHQRACLACGDGLHQFQQGNLPFQCIPPVLTTYMQLLPVYCTVSLLPHRRVL